MNKQYTNENSEFRTTLQHSVILARTTHCGSMGIRCSFYVIAWIGQRPEVIDRIRILLLIFTWTYMRGVNRSIPKNATPVNKYSITTVNFGARDVQRTTFDESFDKWKNHSFSSWSLWEPRYIHSLNPTIVDTCSPVNFTALLCCCVSKFQSYFSFELECTMNIICDVTCAPLHLNFVRKFPKHRTVCLLCAFALIMMTIQMRLG